MSYIISNSLCAPRVHDTDSACFFFQAEDGIRDLVRSRGLGDVYKRQQVNRDRALALIEAGAMLPAGLAAVGTAKANGEWDLSLIHI